MRRHLSPNEGRRIRSKVVLLASVRVDNVGLYWRFVSIGRSSIENYSASLNGSYAGTWIFEIQFDDDTVSDQSVAVFIKEAGWSKSI